VIDNENYIPTRYILWKKSARKQEVRFTHMPNL
jgi:hypothetical protein